MRTTSLATSASVRTTGTLVGLHSSYYDEISIPTKDRVGLCNARDISQHRTTEGVAFDGQTNAFVSSQAYRLRAEPLPQDAVLLQQIVDHFLLLTLDPYDEGQHHKLKRRSHTTDVPRWRGNIKTTPAPVAPRVPPIVVVLTKTPLDRGKWGLRSPSCYSPWMQVCFPFIGKLAS